MWLLTVVFFVEDLPLVDMFVRIVQSKVAHKNTFISSGGSLLSLAEIDGKRERTIWCENLISEAKDMKIKPNLREHLNIDVWVRVRDR